MRIKFHGARGSFPISTTPNEISTISENLFGFFKSGNFASWSDARQALLKEKPRSFYQIYGGATTCAEITTDSAPMPIFVDIGTGFSHAGVDPHSGLNSQDFHTGRGQAAIFLTHTHWDHILGLPTVEQVYRVGNEFHFYGVHKKLSERISNLFQEEHFPVPYRVVSKNFTFKELEPNQIFDFGKLKVTNIPQTHPGGSFAYRFDNGEKSLVFATDVELQNFQNHPNLKPGNNAYSNADLLVLDAQYSPEESKTREGYGHSSIYTAIDFAVREKAKHLVLFHQSPFYQDHVIDDQLERSIEYLKDHYGANHSMKVTMVHEGLELDV